MPEQVAREETILIGRCDAVTLVPASEYKNYLKGFRQMSTWAAAVLAPVVLALILIRWGWELT